MIVETPSSFVTERSGVATSVSVSVELLSPGVGSVPLSPSSETPAVLAIVACPAGNVALATRTRVTEPESPATTVPTAYVSVEPESVQPGFATGLKLMPAGSVSVMTTPVAPCEPLLA